MPTPLSQSNTSPQPEDFLSLSSLSRESRIRAALEAEESNTSGGEYDAALAKSLDIPLAELQRDIENLLPVMRATVKLTVDGKPNAPHVIARALDVIPENQRTVLALQFYERLAFPEMGEVLRISASDAKRESAKALLRLGKELAAPAPKSNRA